MNDDFSARYRLLKCVLVEDGVRTHNAQELATGRVVMVHITDAAAPEEVESLRSRLSLLVGQEKNRVLETATIPSGFAVVTEFLPGSTSFLSWLSSHAVTNSPEAPAPVQPLEPLPSDLAGAKAPQEPGDFTRMFTPLPMPTPSRPQGTDERSGGPPTPKPVQTLPRVTRPSSSPEVERTAARPQPVPAQPVPARPMPAASIPMQAAPPRAEPSAAPGEFTQMFNPGALRQNTPDAFAKPKASAPPPEIPSELPANFGAPLPASFNMPLLDSPAVDAPKPLPAVPIVPFVPPPVATPGEFTRLFNASGLVAPEPEVKRPSAINPELPPSWSPLGAAAGAPVSPIAFNPISAHPPAASHGIPDGRISSYGGFGGPLPISPSDQPVVRESPLADQRRPMGLPGGVPPVVQPPAFRDSDPAAMTPFGGAPKAGPVNAGPSAYTLVMQGGFEQGLAKPAAKPAAAVVEPPPKRSIPIALIAIINVVILLVIALVVYLFGRPRTPTVQDITPAGVSMPKAPAKPKRPA